jgi:hypothetical protein
LYKELNHYALSVHRFDGDWKSHILASLLYFARS